MSSQTQHGYLVLADISGYTSYLAGVEFDHAHEILTDLLDTIVRSFKSLLTIAKLEGDAACVAAGLNLDGLEQRQLELKGKSEPVGVRVLRAMPVGQA